MKIKDGVFTEVTVIRNGAEEKVTISAPIRAAFYITDEVSKKIAEKGIVITSILDGKHKPFSKHYEGNAFDIRIIQYLKTHITKLLEQLKKELGPDFDVVLESDHIHIEYDPK
jgi:hypothetical protein